MGRFPLPTVEAPSTTDIGGGHGRFLEGQFANVGLWDIAFVITLPLMARIMHRAPLFLQVLLHVEDCVWGGPSLAVRSRFISQTAPLDRAALLNVRQRH